MYEHLCTWGFAAVFCGIIKLGNNLNSSRGVDSYSSQNFFPWMLAFHWAGRFTEPCFFFPFKLKTNSRSLLKDFSFCLLCFLPLFSDCLAFNKAQVNMTSYNRLLVPFSPRIMAEGPFCVQDWAVGSVSNVLWEELLSKCVETTDMGNGTCPKPQGVLIILWETTGVTRNPGLPVLSCSCWHCLQNSYGSCLECNWLSSL